jgi:two-component system, NtrC family, sensor kinase
MKKEITLTILLSLAWSVGVSQDWRHIDSLKHELEISQNDTLKLLYLLRIAEAFDEPKPDSAYYYAKEELRIAKKLNLRLNEALALNGIAYALKNMGNYPASLQTYLSANEILEDASIEENILPNRYYSLDGFIKKPVTPRMIRHRILGYNQLGLGLLYETANNYNKALFYNMLAKRSFEEAGNVYNLCFINTILGRVYLSLGKEDSALIFEQTAHDLSIQWDYRGNLPGIAINLGRIHLAMGNIPLAAEYFRSAIKKSREQGYLRGVVAANLLLFDVYQRAGKKDSSVYLANEALGIARYQNAPDLLLRTYTALAAFYNSAGKNDSTVKYQSLMISIKDSLFNSKQAQQFQAIDFDEKQRRLEIEAAEKAYRDRLQIYGMLAGLSMLLVVAIILWHNNRHKQKAYLLLQNQKQETDFQKTKVEQTLEELKSTQTQLIQSEKMASLGELTAGIAHEIQNPLNFVNNFSEVNAELIDELEQEASNANMERVKSIAKNIKDNEEKIVHHGKRADAIVKGMLQHSRASSGVKEPTDINALAHEYLRLAYQGHRAKDKSFSVRIDTVFDPTIGLVKLIPQDIGRVILNLINNAMYVMTEKKKVSGGEYEPAMTVTTRNANDKILITVKDNGYGIRQEILDKIFQPFFTTKPTGQGTGLGLSLSYDIIKGHGGEIKVSTTEGQGAEFIIELPLKSNP